MNHQEQIQAHGKEVIDTLAPMVKWKYDDFHNVMLAEFSVDKADQVMLSLRQVLPVNWDANTIKKAPAEVKHYAGVFAKLTKKQALLSTNVEQKPKVMVAWWPWGHGATVSVRLFLTNTAPFVEKTGFFHSLGKIFS